MRTSTQVMSNLDINFSEIKITEKLRRLEKNTIDTV
jgi:hypothetical protein